MNPIVIIIPTLDAKRGQDTGRLAKLTAGCDAKLIVVSGPKRGFTATVNEGIRRTESEDICLLNDDVTNFQYGWLDTMRKALYSKEKYGIVAPSGDSRTPPMKNYREGMSGLQVVGTLPFWCVLIKRDLIDEIGLLDDSMVHYNSDSWYCIRAVKRGWQLVWVKDVLLHHEKHGSGLIGEWLQKDKARFLQLKKGPR